MLTIWVTLIFIFILIIFTLLVLWNAKRAKETHEYFIFPKTNENDSKPCIFCLMVTGKDEKRIQLARSAVENFKNQDYPHKKLIIINHLMGSNVLKEKQENQDYEKMQTIEINVGGIRSESKSYMKLNGMRHRIRHHIPHHKMSLGQMRNMSLAFVPMGALWTIWDDDDWRPHNYLSTLNYQLTQNNADCIAFTTRYEYNSRTSLSWKMTFLKGYPTILCKQNPKIKYKDVNSMEDVHLIDDIKKIGLKTYIFHNSNNPGLYVRLVHGENTSLYTNPNKKSVRKRKHDYFYTYKEDDINDDEDKFVVSCVKQIMSQT